jgi:ectoine hydroxylase-related dioxygenase (phytanoyl-CoA dioxygenase family)
MTDLGFQIENDVLSPAECDAVSSVLAGGSLARGRAGARHLMASPEVRELASDPRLLRLAAESLGGRAVPYRATLFEKSGRANWLVVWHQDTALPLAATVAGREWGPWSTKAGVLYAHAPAWALDRIVAVRVHLDASTRDNGPLRVIPGSHRAGVLSDDDVFALARRSEAVDCVVARGGVLAMRPLLVHSSSKARIDQPRRVLHIEYADTLDLAHDVRLAVT